MRSTLATTCAALLACIAGGACASPPSPSPAPPKSLVTASTSVATTAPTSDAGTDAAPPPSSAWTPPAPFTAIATASADAPFTIYPLTTTTLVLAGSDKPIVLELEGDNLSTLPSWLDVLGPLGPINLSDDPLFPASNPKRPPMPARPGAHDEAQPRSFSGTREITTVAGVSSSDAWLFVNRWGGEPNVWVRSDAFRRAAGQWQKIATTKKLGIRYAAATAWNGGVLVHEANAGAERFVAFGVKAGVVVPQPARVPPPCKFFLPEAFVPVASGELVAFGRGCGNGTLAVERWAKGAAQGTYQAFDFEWNSAEPEGFARVVSADEIRMRVPGSIDGDESASRGSSMIDIELRFKASTWIVASKKDAPADGALLAKINAASGGKSAPGAQAFELRGVRTLADKTVLAWGEIRVDQKPTANVLLRSRAVGAPVNLR